jgi:hypothetical protein
VKVAVVTPYPDALTAITCPAFPTPLSRVTSSAGGAGGTVGFGFGAVVVGRAVVVGTVVGATVVGAVVVAARVVGGALVVDRCGTDVGAAWCVDDPPQAAATMPRTSTALNAVGRVRIRSLA